ncbi:MAG: hypothetical protein O7C01_05270 [Actinobacteria bacterium]|nr:hypothetical protein [Actinomycetota bacterium]
METSVGRLIEAVGREGLEQVPLQEVSVLSPPLEFGELVRVVTVVDQHRVPRADESIVLEPAEPAHSAESSSMPVSTSVEHIGQVTTGIIPTMNLKPHSGHSIFGMGKSGGGGGGGGGPGPGEPTPGAAG